MKACILLLLTGSLLGLAQAREFKSADGSKTVEADFIRYNPRTGEVTLRMSNGRNMVTKSDFFSDEDQAFFQQEFRKTESEGAISIRGHDRLDRDAYRKDKLVISYTDADYVFTIKNSSEIDFKNLEVKYWVVVERYNQAGPMLETSNGSGAIDLLEKRSEKEVAGPSLRLTTGAAPAHATENEGEARKMASEAAKYGRDRALGWRVEVYDAEGKLLHADSSSSRVDKALGVPDKED